MIDDNSRSRCLTQRCYRIRVAETINIGPGLAELDKNAGRRKDREGRTVAARFEEEKAKLRPLPERPFHARRSYPVSISRQALV